MDCTTIPPTAHIKVEDANQQTSPSSSASLAYLASPACTYTCMCYFGTQDIASAAPESVLDNPRFYPPASPTSHSTPPLHHRCPTSNPITYSLGGLLSFRLSLTWSMNDAGL